MKSSSLTLLPAVAFGSSNQLYDGSQTEFVGLPEKAASYYSKNQQYSQTFAWHVTDFEGIIHIEATLDTDPNTAEWVDLFTIAGADNGAGGYIPLTEDDWALNDGNYTWIRVRVTDFTAGSITRVTLSY